MKRFSLALLFSLLIGAASAQLAGGLMFPGPGTPHSSGGGGLVFTATDSQINTYANLTSGSFSSPVSFGAASSDRIVQIGVMANVDTSALTLNIGGVTATKAVADLTFNNLSIWYANVPTGTTGTVSWTNASGVASLLIVVAQIHGQTGGGGATPSTTAAFGSNMAQPIGPLSVTVPSGGVAFVVGAAFNGTTTPTFTWANTAATNGDETISAIGSPELGSSHLTTSSASVTVSSSSSMSFSGPAMASVSWAP